MAFHNLMAVAFCELIPLVSGVPCGLNPSMAGASYELNALVSDASFGLWAILAHTPRRIPSSRKSSVS